MAMSCFKGIAHALACSASYADGVRQSLLAGGENVGRACLVCVSSGSVVAGTESSFAACNGLLPALPAACCVSGA